MIKKLLDGFDFVSILIIITVYISIWRWIQTSKTLSKCHNTTNKIPKNNSNHETKAKNHKETPNVSIKKQSGKPIISGVVAKRQTTIIGSFAQIGNIKIKNHTLPRYHIINKEEITKEIISKLNDLSSVQTNNS